LTDGAIIFPAEDVSDTPLHGGPGIVPEIMAVTLVDRVEQQLNLDILYFFFAHFSTLREVTFCTTIHATWTRAFRLRPAWQGNHWRLPRCTCPGRPSLLWRSG